MLRNVGLTRRRGETLREEVYIPVLSPLPPLQHCCETLTAYDFNLIPFYLVSEKCRMTSQWSVHMNNEWLFNNMNLILNLYLNPQSGC